MGCQRCVCRGGAGWRYTVEVFRRASLALAWLELCGIVSHLCGRIHVAIAHLATRGDALLFLRSCGAACACQSAHRSLQKTLQKAFAEGSLVALARNLVIGVACVTPVACLVNARP